jgi:hypothetical protein
LHAVVNYLAGKDTNESSADLRGYVERQNGIQNTTFNDYKASSSADIKKLFECDKNINTVAKRIDLDLNKFVLYCDNFKT